MPGGRAGSELAEADPDPSGGKDPSGRADRLAHHRYEDHPGGGESPPQAYRRRRFPAGDLSGGPAGPDESQKCPAGAGVFLQPGGALGDDRAGHQRYPDHEREL